MDLLCCVVAMGIHLGSAHIDPYPTAPKLYDQNPGVYIQFSNNVVMGAFQNSLRKPSAYLGYELQLIQYKAFELSVIGGGITGYPQAAVVPLIMPTIRLAIDKHTGIRMGYLPKIQATQAHVLHFMVERRF